MLVWSYLKSWFIPTLTFIIEDSGTMGPSQMYKAAEVYILTKIYDVAEATPRIKIDPSTNQLYISVASRERRFIVDITNGEEIVDTYQNIKLTWRFVHIPPPDKESPEIRYFKLIIKKKFKDMVFGYLKHILDEADAINERQKVLKLYNPRSKEGVYQGPWVCVPLEHPATFETLAMDPDLKQHIIEDLNLFKSRKEFYNRVGRAWKRGYLLNGPPGTGKSSLIAAMANHLKFDIYDLQLTDIHNDNELRSILLKTNNRSIVVIEDVDRIDMSEHTYIKKKDMSVESSTSQVTNLYVFYFLWLIIKRKRILIQI
jgi:hypothetical protein